MNYPGLYIYFFIIYHILVFFFAYMRPHTTTATQQAPLAYAQAHHILVCRICVLILHMCPHTTPVRCSALYVCHIHTHTCAHHNLVCCSVLYMCPHTTVQSSTYTFPHTSSTPALLYMWARILLR
jgi:hypothetical protein